MALSATGFLALSAAVASVNAHPAVCGSSRADELAAHGREALRPGSGRALAELALALGFAEHPTPTRIENTNVRAPGMVMATQPTPDPVPLVPTTRPNDLRPRGGAMRVEPRDTLAPRVPDPPRTPHRTPRRTPPPHPSGGASAVLPNGDGLLGTR
jgi:hypothetical protein